MREWFIVGAKLLGIYFFYWALMSLLSLIVFLLTFLPASGRLTPEPTNVIISVVVTFAIAIAFSFLLLFKTHAIADRLHLVGDSSISVKTDGRPLQSGLVLIGIYIFFSHIGKLFKVIFYPVILENAYSPIDPTQLKDLTRSKDLIDPIITILFSLILIFSARQLAGWLEKAKTDKI